jgi:4a-hydroxytetrahydrobiopterin dehydratase
MKPEALDDTTLAEAASTLPREVRSGALHREYRFAEVVQAFAFMTAAALNAERLDHHPEWANSDNRVVVDLRTDSVEAISDRSVALAGSMEQVRSGRHGHHRHDPAALGRGDAGRDRDSLVESTR